MLLIQSARFATRSTTQHERVSLHWFEFITPTALSEILDLGTSQGGSSFIRRYHSEKSLAGCDCRQKTGGSVRYNSHPTAAVHLLHS